MSNSLKKYDLTLLCINFRFHPYYLNIVKEMGVSSSVCLYYVNDKKQVWTKKTEKQYLTKCKEYGADFLYEGEECSCVLLMMIQPFFNNLDLKKFKKINYDRIILVQHVRGLDYLDDNSSLGAQKLWVYNRKIFDNQIRKGNLEHLLDAIEITEVEMPYQKYPAFDFSNLNIDYLIAFPTQIFLKDKRNEKDLFCNMCKILKSIPNEKTVYIKQHNVSEEGNRLNKSHSKLKLIYEIILLFIKIVINKAFGRKGEFSDAVFNLRIKLAQRFIQKRSTPLYKVTDYHNMNIEHFLPFVKEGVITGISAVIMNALLEGIPVYNCDSQPISEDLPNWDIYESFMIPYCESSLKFDVASYDLVKSHNKRYDMIELLKQELDQV